METVFNVQPDLTRDGCSMPFLPMFQKLGKLILLLPIRQGVSIFTFCFYLSEFKIILG
jgi:hypothetical protein